MNRDAAITAFLTAHGYGAAQMSPLAQDASFRRYLRISGGPRSAVLMDAPPPEDVRPFLRIQAHLDSIGLSVPAVLAADAEAGLLLEEDLGDALLSVLLDASYDPPSIPSAHPTPSLTFHLSSSSGLAQGSVSPQAGDHADPRVKLEDDEGQWRASPPAIGDAGARSRPEGTERREAASLLPIAMSATTALFDAAVDALIPLQRAAPPAGLPTWGATEMRDTALGTLFDWWWPAAFGSAAPDAARADIAEALTAILAPLTIGPRCMVHRDFFAGNLLWLPDRPAPRNVGVIDFQGAAVGHPAYDLVSLVQDARRDIPASIQDRAVARYLAARPDLDPTVFRNAFAVCAAQRHLRVACQWVRLARRDNRPQYLAFGPRTWRLLGQALSLPAVAPLAAALDRWIPLAARGNPPGEPSA